MGAAAPAGTRREAKANIARSIRITKLLRFTTGRCTCEWYLAAKNSSLRECPSRRWWIGIGCRIVGASMRQFSAAVCVTLLLAVYAAAEQAPATQPAASEPSYHAAVISPGFHAIAANNHTVFCQPQDDQWIQSALKSHAPATRPTTMPSDLVARIAQKRGQVKSDMMRRAGFEGWRKHR